MHETLNYQTLQLPAARCEVLFAKIGAQEPVIDLRSIFSALGMGWERWHACALLVGSQQGLTLRVGRDASGRPTRLVWASQVPKLIEHMVPAVVQLHPAAARRMSRLGGEWGTNWGRSVAPPAFPSPINATGAEVGATGGSDYCAASYALVPKRSAVSITREVEASVLALSARGVRGAEIARQLNISATSVCLLKKGKFRFASSEAARSPIPAPSTRRRAARPKTEAVHG